jgi:hypothetical protein
MPSGGNRTPLTMSGQFLTTFQPGSLFSPGVPPTPLSVETPRRFDFPVGQNLQYTPRAYEPFGFPQLRAFANVELVRMAIETRKDQIERLDWQVRPKAGRKKRADHLDRIRAVEKFLRKPDGATHFATWLRILLEELLVLDAPAIERRRNYGGDLVALDIVAGDTVKILIDDNGRLPLAPAPAYQQVIKGRIWADLTTEELIYAPRNPRAAHLYGLGPVEQTIVTINTILRRQAQQLAYFTDGNLPAGLVNVPEGWTVDQVKDWQDWMDARLSGNLAERSKILWAPAGAKYQGFKDAPIKDEFDEWLARVICFAFSLPPTPFIRQMNRSTSDNDSQRSLEEGMAPLQLWAKRLFDSVIQDDLGYADLEFAWNSVIDTDPETQAKINDVKLRNGSITIDEAREEDGREPVPGGLGAKHLIYTGRGAIPLEEAVLPRQQDDSAEGDAPANGKDAPAESGNDTEDDDQ